MTLLRAKGYPNELERVIYSGDVLGLGEVISANATAGSSTLTAASIATGIINRTGPGGGYTDTWDTAVNIIAALGGANNGPGANVAPGTTFRLRYINTVAFLSTFAGGQGIISGAGTLNVAASSVRDYLLTVLNSSPLVNLNATFGNASAAVVFTLPPNMTAFPLGSADNPQGIAITPGMGIVDNTTGGNVPALTTVLGLTYGAGGITGVTMSANSGGASAAAPGDNLTFFPRIKVDSLGLMTL